MRWWFYAVLSALPLVIGASNARAGGDFLPVFAAAMFFAMMAAGSMETALLTRRLRRRPQAGAAALKGLSHRAA